MQHIDAGSSLVVGATTDWPRVLILSNKNILLVAVTRYVMWCMCWFVYMCMFVRISPYMYAPSLVGS